MVTIAFGDNYILFARNIFFNFYKIGGNREFLFTYSQLNLVKVLLRKNT
ncbi:hypothetical protein SAMN04489723_10368 [Algoriphagus aquimarinus]|uniref:Uncharacterized protein n=1 Tax=Algoriphagus aquimarinus TaxID=237018 RepID=A0A1I0XCC1_9BACT|nr:hypothetical protein SAMN04489723_10368 [Algoriphagus aquimarinus]